MDLNIVLVAASLVAGAVQIARLRPLPIVATTAGAERRPTVSVLIPARDEEGNLPELLRSLAEQALPHEVVVADDGSTDRTAAVAHDAGARVEPVAAPPPGWLGKPWACLTAAERSTGEVLVFLDADTALGDGALEAVVDHHQRTCPRGLLSVQPYHETERAYEQLSAFPNLLSIMATGAFALGAPTTQPVAFGPCLVTTRAAYDAVGGHRAVAGEVIEDVHLAKAYAAAGRPVAAAFGGHALRYRMYPGGAAQLVEGWTKNLAGGPGLVAARSLVAAVLWVLGPAVATGALASSALAGIGGGALEPLALVLWAAVALQLTWLARRIGRFRWWLGPAFPLLFVGFVALFARSWWRRVARGRVTWRGREIATGPAAR